MWLVNANIVDVVTGEVRMQRAVHVEDGIIVDITSRVPSDARGVVDVGHRYLLPGLISCHTHLSVVFPFSDLDEAENPAVTAYRSAQRAHDALVAGITTLRCVHEQNQADLLLRQAAERGWIRAPRIFGAGRAISTPEGHGKGGACVYAEGEAGFYEAGRNELRAGADHLKIFISGGLARAGESPDHAEMTDEEIAGTVRAAHEHDSYVVAHSGGWREIAQALRQGVRSFEHAYQLNAETASAVAAKGAYVTPTLCVTNSEPWMRARGFEEASISNALAAHEQHQASIKHAIAAGVHLVNGTDFPPGDLVDGVPAAIHEMFLMHGVGLDRLKTLQSITSTAAALLRQEHRLGQVQTGFVGDFVAAEANPLDDLQAMRELSLVVQGGTVIRDARTN